ncbi:DUF4242 domain-containing protein [Candidatus Bathyarchaeota archaeon]|nr:DUF4242 domain-containing protein [Candidatus Bathyarchaeota archaeon]
MAKFLAVHTLPAPVTVEEAAYMGKAVKSNLTADAYWVSSWVQLNDEGKIVKIYCEWNAKNADAIREVFSKIQGFPVDGIYGLAVVDPETL